MDTRQQSNDVTVKNISILLTSYDIYYQKQKQKTKLNKYCNWLNPVYRKQS